ncbi:hypothetical protein FVEG_17625 [Fusarium verticillioides 7600]|nr:hypothetical protein FVEG_17625 [Fusarium verticillioides 7600]KYG13570.1 hypothetical protein FVEG_17625 [Fusarium verticillioides 7600]
MGISSLKYVCAGARISGGDSSQPHRSFLASRVLHAFSSFVLQALYLVSMDNYEDDFQSTPTGKVSKAKKGKPVHVCSECQKVYTRAEHLRYNFYTYTRDEDSMLTLERRHQSSHQEPQFECPVCQRRFHRKDLLERHYKR